MRIIVKRLIHKNLNLVIKSLVINSYLFLVIGTHINITCLFHSWDHLSKQSKIDTSVKMRISSKTIHKV